jgi:transposase
VHVTETCDEETPHLLMHVETTPATTQDMEMTAVIPEGRAKAGQGFDAASFAIDWEAKQATCPQGKLSRKWKPTHDRGDTQGSGSSLANTTACTVLAARSVRQQAPICAN